MKLSPMTQRGARLIDLLTDDQLELMLDLLRKVCVSGYGIFAIEIMDGKVRFYRVTFSIPALPVSRNEQKG